MNENASTSPQGWERPVSGYSVQPGRPQVDVDAWWALVDRVIDVATSNGWNKAEVARRVGMASGTFSQWFSGKYVGRLDAQNEIVSRWLDAVEDQAGLAAAIPTSPAFLKLKTTIEIMDTLRWAQMAPDFVAVTIAAGMGKSWAGRHYRTVTPHVYMATVSPNTKTVHGMLVELCAALDVQEHNPAKMVRAIGNRLSRIGAGTLLIIDEAQNLTDDAVNQLRHFTDEFQCGIALLGNDEIYSRFMKKADGPSFAQLKSRIGKRLKREKPRLEDLQAYIAAWNVTDPECGKFLIGIGMKGGALRQIDKTMKLASMLAIGAGQTVGLEHIRAAWKNRDVEDLS
jgi:DNA transposition AAA+ family ATPase